MLKIYLLTYLFIFIYLYFLLFCWIGQWPNQQLLSVQIHLFIVM